MAIKIQPSKKEIRGQFNSKTTTTVACKRKAFNNITQLNNRTLVLYSLTHKQKLTHTQKEMSKRKKESKHHHLNAIELLTELDNLV